MNLKKRKWYMKGLVQMSSLLILAVVDMSVTSGCWLFFHQPKVPAHLLSKH